MALHPETERASETLRVLILDEMTGLYNPAYFSHRLRDDVRRSLRYDCPLSLILLKPDQILQLQTPEKEMYADRTLAEIGGMLRKMARDTDLPGRLADATFGLLLPGTPGENALTVAERFRKRAQTHPFCGADQIEVTLSIGVSKYAAKQTPEEFYEDAEISLRKAHHLGGNSVVYQGKPVRLEGDA